MSLTVHTDLDAIRLGTVAGFYPVSGIENPNEEQLWIPKTLQEYEARCLANDIADDGFRPDIIFGIARGGMMVAQEIAYNNNTKRVGMFQTSGYDDNNQPLEEPILIGTPDVTDMNEDMSVLLVDELIDEGKALRVVYEWLQAHLIRPIIKTAVIYDKDRPHVFIPDYVGRLVPNVWLDHESQADRERLRIRFEQLRKSRGHLMRAMGFLSTEPPNKATLQELLKRS